MEVYFLRHGETEWNRKKKIQGSNAWIDLTSDGVRVATAARDGMLAKGLSFDRLYSSPYRRALHTAQIIGSGFGLEPIVDNRLHEISFGPYEGTSYGDGLFADDNIRCCFKDPLRYVPREGCESFDDVFIRVRDFLDRELAPMADRLSRVLVVAHGGVLRTVLRISANVKLEDFWNCAQPNCCAHVVDFFEDRILLKARSVTYGV